MSQVLDGWYLPSGERLVDLQDPREPVRAAALPRMDAHVSTSDALYVLSFGGDQYRPSSS